MNIPEFLIPTMREAPMAPIRLRLGVASSRVSIKTLTPSLFKNKLAVLLSLNSLFHHDFENGVLEQMLISHHSLPLLILSKITAHWLLTGIPIILLSPLLG
jgi:heme exporter protein CcmB